MRGRVQPLVSAALKGCLQVRVLQRNAVGRSLRSGTARRGSLGRRRGSDQVLQLLRVVTQVQVVEHVETRAVHVLDELRVLVGVRLARRGEQVTAVGDVLSSLLTVRRAHGDSLAQKLINRSRRLRLVRLE